MLGWGLQAQTEPLFPRGSVCLSYSFIPLHPIPYFQPLVGFLAVTQLLCSSAASVPELFQQPYPQTSPWLFSPEASVPSNTGFPVM